jgi:hypothetical protein
MRWQKFIVLVTLCHIFDGLIAGVAVFERGKIVD